MTIFLTADTHFGHSNVLQYSNRPFADAEAMDAALIGNWNSRVKPADTVWFLGDFALTPPDKALAILEQLHGEKRLIAGNHDHKKLIASSLWASHTRLLEITMHLGGADRLVTLCHYPLVTWNKMRYGGLHFHGHSHGHYPSSRQHLDVGVDCHGYAPITLEEAWAKMQALPEYQPVDHHRAAL